MQKMINLRELSWVKERQSIYLANKSSPILLLAARPTRHRKQKESKLKDKRRNRKPPYAVLVPVCVPASVLALSKSNALRVSLHRRRLSKKDVMAVLKFLTWSAVKCTSMESSIRVICFCTKFLLGSWSTFRTRYAISACLLESKGILKVLKEDN